MCFVWFCCPDDDDEADNEDGLDEGSFGDEDNDAETQAIRSKKKDHV